MFDQFRNCKISEIGDVYEFGMSKLTHEKFMTQMKQMLIHLGILNIFSAENIEKKLCHVTKYYGTDITTYTCKFLSTDMYTKLLCEKCYIF